MMNRLFKCFLASVLTLGLTAFFQPVLVNAQFSFSYPGPNVLAVGPTCSTPLSPQLGTPIVTSTGGAITVSQIDSVASGFGLYAATWTTGEQANIVWHVEDAMGNMANFFFSVTFADLTGPVFDLTGIPTLIQVSSIVQVPPAPNIPVVDNCTSTSTTFVETTPPGICMGGTFTRTWTASDTNANTTVFTQTIIVYNDTLPPQVQVSPANGAAPCDQLATAYPNWLSAQMAAFNATDASTPIAYTNNAPPTFPLGCAMPITVTFQATDACGLKSTRTAVFTTSDNTPPVITRIPQDSVVACSPTGNQLVSLADWIHRKAGMNYQDACSTKPEQVVSMQVNGQPADSAQVVAAFINSFNNGCGTQQIGSTTYDKIRAKVTVSFSVKDPCNNSTNAGLATFAAMDTLPPIITGDSLHLEQCGGGNDQQQLIDWIEDHGGATLSDDCSGAVWTSFTWTTSTGNTGVGAFGSGPYPQVQANNCNWFVDVTFRATDDCGNIGAATLRFKIYDDIPPVLSGFQPIVTIYCPQAFPTAFPGNVTDNCDNNVAIAHAYVFSDTTCVGNYTLKVTWTGTDDCGNSSAVQQTYLVRDTLAPVFNLVPANITASCETYTTLVLPVPGTDVTATDVCGAMNGITVGEISNQNPNPAVCGHYNFTLTRIFTASDVCGNTSTATQQVQVQDNVGPVLTGFLDTMLACEVTPITPAPTASDNCSGILVPPFTIDTVITAGACPDAYTMTLTWQATDVCGNTGTFSQNVIVQDTMRPTLQGIPADITVECNMIPGAPALASISGSDNCDEDVTVVMNEYEIRDPNLSNCAHWTNYIVVREWTASDNCGNSRTYTQQIHVEDTTPPEIVLPNAVMLPSSPGLCGANVVPPAPLSVFDDCTAQAANIMLSDTAALQTAGGGQSSTLPVDTIFFSWAAPNMPPLTPAIDSATLTISLRNADADGLAEYLLVYGEDNVLLGKTAQSPLACADSDTSFKIPPALLNAWLTDGTLDITLTPVGTGSSALNPYCPGGGQAIAKITYPVATQQVPLTVTFKIDNGPVQVFPTVVSTFLSVGSHEITYTATDCAGNSSTATIPVVVEDVEPPYLSSTPPSTAYVDADCMADVLLPFPNIVENCSLFGNYLKSSNIVPVKFEMDPDIGNIPKEVTLVVTGAVPNAVTGGVLRIKHKGDNAQAALGEFYRVFGEDSNTIPIATTTPGSMAGECSTFHVSTITLSAATINNWAADNQIRIKLRPNKDLLSYTDFISPCAAVNPVDSTDGISSVQIEIEYDYAVVNYDVQKSPSGPVLFSGQLFGNQTEVNLGPGDYVVHYDAMDATGLIGTTSYPLLVRDTIRPMAFCKNKTIFVNVSGETNYTLTAAEINNGSTDNCSGTNLSFQLNPSVFNCNQAGANYAVTLTVTDTSGNAATCQSIVRVETAPFTPTYDQVCLGDTLRLYANPPATPGGPGIFTYLWTYPNASTATQQNPVLPNTSMAQEGLYTIKLTGLTGCTATATVFVDLINLPNQPTIQANSVCAGSDILLTAMPAFNGIGVSYEWYTGTLASPVLVATTPGPTLSIIQPAPGTYQYFVKIIGNGCVSLPSALTPVQVFNLPVASIQQGPAISLCECDARVLGTTVQNNNPPITYVWSGPNGFSSNQQFPPVKSCVALADSGIYTLIVYQNGCASLPVNTQITVKPKPPVPQIMGATQVCEGATVQLMVGNIPTAENYYWIGPGLDTIITGTNKLIRPAVSLADSGSWRVIVVQQGCYSDASLPALLQVQAYPQVFADANAPLCEGTDSLHLMASASTGGLSYMWTGPNSYVSNQQNPNPPPVAGWYKVKASTSFGCADTDSVLVQFTPVPIISSVTNDAPICADGNVPVTLSSVVVSAYPIVTYQWFGPSFFSTMSSPFIPSANSSKNGTYVLTVFDSLGCRSLSASTVIDIHDIPPTPTIAQPAAVCVGETVTLQLTNATSYQNGSFDFVWTLPNNSQVVTTQPVYTISNAQTGNSGQYKVLVTSDTCTSLESVPVTVTINPYPNPPVITATPNPVCEGSTLNLSVPLIPGATYDWIAPFGPDPPNLHSVNISNIALNQAGIYYCRITINGCTSLQGEGLIINVLPRPAQPIIAAPIAAVCLDQNVDTLSLKLTTGSTTPNATYTWYNSSNEVLAGPSLSTTFKTTDFSNFNPSQNSYFVVANLNGCVSAASPVVMSQFDTIPAGIIAYAGEDRPICAAQPFMLNASAPATGTGRWMPVAGQPATVIVNPPLFNSNVSGAVAGNVYQYAWALSNGACKNFSADTVVITAVAFEQAVAQTILDTCFAESVTLNATQGQNTTGIWTQVPGQALLGVTINEPLNPKTSVSNLDPAETYYFYWTLADIGCGTSTIEVVVRNIGTEAYAGPDANICNMDSCVVLNAAPLADNETGKWTSTNPFAVIANPASPNTTACGLQVGDNTFYWVTNEGLCGDLSRDTVVVHYEITPITRHDTVYVAYGSRQTFNVLTNDILPPQYNVVVQEQPQHGTFEVQSKGIYTYQPAIGFTGVDQMLYRVCNLNCSDACNTAKVTIIVLEPDDCVIPTVITLTTMA
ncbi:MAG: hypothetical protein IPL65_12230 [Lewinellaceae bacterium]|nr:hypothetical protein [Lewinellaceae bacterium]